MKIGDPISVWWLDGEVFRAVVETLNLPIFSYSLRLANDVRGATGLDTLGGEGYWWCRGHEGPAVNALKTVVALRRSA